VYKLLIHHMSLYVLCALISTTVQASALTSEEALIHEVMGPSCSRAILCNPIAFKSWISTATKEVHSLLKEADDIFDLLFNRYASVIKDVLRDFEFLAQKKSYTTMLPLPGHMQHLKGTYRTLTFIAVIGFLHEYPHYLKYPHLFTEAYVGDASFRKSQFQNILRHLQNRSLNFSAPAISDALYIIDHLNKQPHLQVKFLLLSTLNFPPFFWILLVKDGIIPIPVTHDYTGCEYLKSHANTFEGLGPFTIDHDARAHLSEILIGNLIARSCLQAPGNTKFLQTWAHQLLGYVQEGIRQGQPVHQTLQRCMETFAHLHETPILIPRSTFHKEYQTNDPDFWNLITRIQNLAPHTHHPEFLENTPSLPQKPLYDLATTCKMAWLGYTNGTPRCTPEEVITILSKMVKLAFQRLHPSAFESNALEEQVAHHCTNLRYLITWIKNDVLYCISYPGVAVSLIYHNPKYKFFFIPDRTTIFRTKTLRDFLMLIHSPYSLQRLLVVSQNSFAGVQAGFHAHLHQTNAQLHAMA